MLPFVIGWQVLLLSGTDAWGDEGMKMLSMINMAMILTDIFPCTPSISTIYYNVYKLVRILIAALLLGFTG